jgi:hypothetical protein
MAPIQVVLAGSMCQDLHDIKHPDVEFLGELSSTSTFYDAVDIVVVPMTASTGLKIKVAEALSHHVPVISHRHAFEGFDPSHPWHQLDSLEDIASSCIDAAFDSSLIPPLRDASRTAQDRLQASVSAGVASTLAAVRNHRPALLIETDPAALNPKGLAYARFEALSRFTGFAANVVLFVDFPLSADQENTLARLSDSHKIVFGPSAKSSTDQKTPSVTRQQLAAAWGADQVLLSNPDLIPHWRQGLPPSHCVILDLVGSDNALPAGLLRKEDILLANSSGTPPSVDSINAERVIPSSILENALPRPIASAWTGSGRDAADVHVFVPAGCKSIRSYRTLLDAGVPSNCPITYLLDPGLDESALNGGGRLLSVPAAFGDLTTLGPRPRYSVKLPGASSASSSALQDLYRLSAIPAIALSAPTARFPASNSFEAPQTLFDLHRSLYRLATDDKLIENIEQRALAISATYKEEGWSLLWQLLTRPRSPETVAKTDIGETISTDLFRQIS